MEVSQELRAANFGQINDLSHESSQPESHYPGRKYTLRSQSKVILLSSWPAIVSIPAVPAGFAVKYSDQSPIVTFVVNFIAILLLGRILDVVTEELKTRWGEKGMFILVTSSNAIQLVVAIIALIKHESPIVQTSLIGAVLSNSLLIVGIGFFLGGLRYREQYFDSLLTGSFLNELVLSVAALILPTAIHSSNAMDANTLAKFSRGEALLLLVSYLCYIRYSLGSHSHRPREPHRKASKWKSRVYTGEALEHLTQTAVGLAGPGGRKPAWREPQEILLPKVASNVLKFTLVIDIILLGFCSTFAVDSIDGLTQETLLTQNFVGLILLPLLSCNLHAIKLARDDKLPESFAISISSSVQLLLLVLPLAVIIAWIRNDPTMTLLFDLFQVIVLAVSVMMLKYITADEKSNWYGTILFGSISRS
ncbi:hypothetical protein ACLMJK_007718 [Lecanora helva]